MFSPVEVVVALLLVVACSARFDPSNPNVQECLKENGLDVDKVKEMVPHGPGEAMKPELRCVMKCLLEKEGALKPDGTLDVDMIEERMKEAGSRIQADKIPEVLECVKKIDKIESCDDISKMRACHHALFKHDQ